MSIVGQATAPATSYLIQARTFTTSSFASKLNSNCSSSQAKRRDHRQPHPPSRQTATSRWSLLLDDFFRQITCFVSHDASTSSLSLFFFHLRSLRGRPCTSRANPRSLPHSTTIFSQPFRRRSTQRTDRSINNMCVTNDSHIYFLAEPLLTSIAAVNQPQLNIFHD